MFSPFLYLRSLKAKYQSLVILKIIRAVDKDKQLTRTSTHEAMIMLKKAWREVTEQTIQNCFRKSGISLEAQEGAMDDHVDPFKGMVDDGEDDSAVDELQFDQNQLHKARPGLAPENLDANELIDFDREVVTNESRPLSVDEIVKEYLPQLVETVEDPSTIKKILKTKIKSYGDESTDFQGEELPKAGPDYICLAKLSMDFVLKKYRQVFLK